MVVLSGHSDPVNAVSFSHDGRWLASAADDGAVCLWDVALQTGMVRIGWGAKWVFAVAFSPDGQSVAAGTESSLLLLRESEGAWKPHQQWRDHHSWVKAVAFDRDGQLLVSGGEDGSIRVWDAKHRRKNPLRVFNGHIGPIRSIAVSPDGTAIAAGGVSGLGMWKPTDPEPMFFHRLRDADARSLAFSPDGGLLLAAATRCVLKADWRSGDVQEVLSDRSRGFRSLAASPSEPLILVGREDGTTLSWDYQANAERQVYSWHTGVVNGVACHPSGLMAASGGDDYAVCYWNLNPANGGNSAVEPQARESDAVASV
jgi:WD40 repeat protein